MKLGKYSIGTGDRFGQQNEAQLKAIQMVEKEGIEVTPVWNKSNREHITIGSEPSETREKADNAVKALGWTKPYFVDADHINLETVERFIEHSNFFTIDVADFIGKKATKESTDIFVNQHKKYAGPLHIPGVAGQTLVSPEFIKEIAGRFLFATQQAGIIFRHIKERKQGEFIVEVSVDELPVAQTPVELFFILSALAKEDIPVQTIAPKFTGRFNKGVDYAGDIKKFEKEFEENIKVIDFAIDHFKLPENLKLSVHTGSDKFSLYPVIGKLIRKHNKGIHIKTAGTTWLEEVNGLALAGGESLDLVKEFYSQAYQRFEELTLPYASVIDIDFKALPLPGEVNTWDGEKFAQTLRHIQDNSNYNMHFRQLMHVGYKIAAENKEKFLHLLQQHKELTGKQVTENIYERHLKRIFDL